MLVVDWDLEAPGIERYFKQYVEIEGDGVGLLTHAWWTSKKARCHLSRATASPSGSRASTIWCSSPAAAATILEGYSRALEHFNWPRFFRRGGGHRLEALREEWKAEFDFVLVDSRTGLSDSGWSWTIQLPDVVVADVHRQRAEPAWQTRCYAVRPAGPAGAPVHSNAACGDTGAVARFGGFRVPRSRRPGFAGLQRSSTSSSRTGCLGALTLPISSNGSRSQNIEYFSFGERLAVVEQGTTDPVGMGFAFSQIARVLENELNDVVLDSPLNGPSFTG